MHKFLFVLGAALVSCGVSCRQVAVETTLGPDPDLARYSTFAQVPPAWPHPLVGETIETAIASELEKKGYRRRPRGEAELVVTFGARGDQRSRMVNAADPDVDVWQPEAYIAGTVEIDVFDRERRLLLWKGVGQIDLPKEEDAPRAARRAVRAILARFPKAARDGS